MLIFKWLHIVAVISWMAGILYLFRLFVYHAEKGLSSHDNHELLCLMEKRLYKFITIPAMLVTWVAGFGMMAWAPGYFSAGWFHAKLFLVILLTGATHYGGALVKKFARKADGLPTGKFLRIFNEVPTILMIIIVFLVVFKLF